MNVPYHSGDLECDWRMPKHFGGLWADFSDSPLGNLINSIVSYYSS